jgi:hypothetical protein
MLPASTRSVWFRTAIDAGATVELLLSLVTLSASGRDNAPAPARTAAAGESRTPFL